jgi:GrpB-like predicted nucleotidyltransferase (UPF0157 family)
LRSCDQDRQRYEGAKRNLATRPWPHMQAYADAKSSIVEEIIASAMAATQPPS